MLAKRRQFRPCGRKPDAPGGHQARSEVRSTATRAAVRGLGAPDEVGGPLWVGFGGGLRTFGLLMGEKLEPTGTSALPGGVWQAKSCCEMEVGSQTVPVWSPAGKASSILLHYPTTPLLREPSAVSAG
jgi:hypothetical protein